MLLGKLHFLSSVNSSGWNSHMFSQVLYWLTTVFSALSSLGMSFVLSHVGKVLLITIINLKWSRFYHLVCSAEFGVCDTYNGKSLSCLATSIRVWILLLEQCIEIVTDALFCFQLLVLPHFLILSFLLLMLFPFSVLWWSPLLLMRAELAFWRLSIPAVSHWRGGNLGQHGISRGC